MVGIRHAPTIDIHVDSPYNGLVLLKGSSYECPSYQLTGNIELKAQDSCSAKRLHLRLIGLHKLDFHHLQGEGDQQTMSVVREETTVLECHWDDLLNSPEGHITKQYRGAEDDEEEEEDTSSGYSPSSNSSSYSNLFHLGSTSVGPPPHAIPHGKHLVPFQVVLPGDIPETIEGLISGSVTYRLEATLEKPSSTFKSNVVKHKYLRIMRTMSADALSMSETMSIGSTWPGKVQYEFSIPSKAVPIGSATNVHILLVPLIKGIKLGAIKAQVVQQYVLKSVKKKQQTFQESQVISETTITDHQGTILMDNTNIESLIDIPEYLKLVTPNCDLPNDIVKVRHKVKLQIELRNPDGHTSELRTNLPITLYLSPHSPVKARCTEMDKYGKIYFLKDSETLFEDEAEESSGDENEQLPTYESHVYDTPVGSPSMSPMNSGFNTPMPRIQQINHIDDYFSLPQSNSRAVSPMLIPHEQLREQLTKLSFERISQVPSYEEAITDTPNSPELELSPEYEPDDHYQLGESGLSISIARRRYTDSTHSPMNHSPLSHSQNYSLHSTDRSSSLRSTASTTNLLNKHQVHSHSPLADINSKRNSVSTSNLSKLMGVSKLLKNQTVNK